MQPDLGHVLTVPGGVATLMHPTNYESSVEAAMAPATKQNSESTDSRPATGPAAGPASGQRSDCTLSFTPRPGWWIYG
jgi:hypothetical protein